MPRVHLLLVLALLAPIHAAAEAIVTAVERSSAAAEAGLRVGDVILVAADVPVSQRVSLEYALRRAREAGAETVTVRFRRAGRELTVRMKLSAAGLEILPNDPPDRLARGLLALPRHRDSARVRELIAELLDHAPGVGELMLTTAVARSAAGDATEATTRLELARFVAASLEAPIAALEDGPRRRRLAAERTRLDRRLKTCAKWTADQRRQFVYAMRFQKLGVNFMVGGKHWALIRPNWEKALAIYRGLGDHDNALIVQANLALLYQRFGRDPADAVRLMERAWQLSRRRKLELDQARIASLLGSSYLLSGDVDQALETLRAGLEIATRLGQTPREVQLRDSLSAALWLRRRPGAAEAQLREALAVVAGPADRAMLRAKLARLARQTGRFDEALARLARASADLGQVHEPSPDTELMVRREQFLVRIEAGQLAEARAASAALASLPWAPRHRLFAATHYLAAERATRASDRWSARLRAAGSQLLGADLAGALNTVLTTAIPLSAWRPADDQ